MVRNKEDFYYIQKLRNCLLKDIYLFKKIDNYLLVI